MAAKNLSLQGELDDVREELTQCFSGKGAHGSKLSDRAKKLMIKSSNEQVEQVKAESVRMGKLMTVSG